MVVEHATDSAIEAVNAGVLAVHLLTCERLPEVDFLPSVLLGGVASHNPCVRALAIRADNNVGVQAETQQQVAQQHSVILTVTAALRI